MKPLHEILLPVQKRLWIASIIRGAMFGFLLGIGVAFVVAMVRMMAMPTMHWLDANQGHVRE